MSANSSPRNNSYDRSSGENPNLRSVQTKANEVTDIARDNIRMSIAQVDKLQDMEEKSANLEQSSQDFHRGAKRVRRMMCVRSWKMLALIVCGVSILIIIIVAPIAVETNKK